MINIMIRKNRIEVKGHATGSEIVCAAVSALTQTLVQGLVEITQDSVSWLTDSGNMIIEWKILSDSGRVLIDTWYLGICSIQENYGYIKII